MTVQDIIRCRLVAIRPASFGELRDAVVDRARGIILQESRAHVSDGEVVLIDIRVGVHWVVLPAVVRYTLPEGRGPLFIVGTEASATLRWLMSSADTVPLRRHLRFPVSFPARLDSSGMTSIRARVIDLSSVSARIATDTPLALGAHAKLRLLCNLPGQWPRTLSGYISGDRKDGLVLLFEPKDRSEECNRLRWALRRSLETGSAAFAGVQR